MGTDWGLTVQQKVLDGVTVEGIVQSSLQREEMMVTFLAEKHYGFLGKRLNTYFGAGPHFGWINQTDIEPGVDLFENPAGISFIGGLEFSLGDFNISYDIKPAVNIKGGYQGFYTQSGISLRYVILKKHPKDTRAGRKKAKAKAKAKAAKNGTNSGGLKGFWEKIKG